MYFCCSIKKFPWAPVSFDKKTKLQKLRQNIFSPSLTFWRTNKGFRGENRRL